MVRLALTRASAMVSDPVAACQKGNIRSDITAISNRDRSISMNGKAASDPAIAANTECACIKERPDDLRILSDLIADGTQEPSLSRKKARPAQDVVDRVEDDPFSE